jgi:hypothetical protein
MLREAIGLLPDVVARCPLGTALALCALGVVLWTVGGRVSRSILALMAVAGGSVVGIHLPEWFGWQVEGMAIAVGAAIVLGCAVLFMHRTCIGVLLGLTMMLWAALGTWLFMASADATWNWRSAHWEGDMVQYLHQLWQGLPPDMARVFPAACFAGFATGVTVAVFFPKLSKVLTHSLMGVTLVALMGAVAASTARPKLLASVPGSNAAQGLALVGVVILGALIQWRITPPLGTGGGAGSKARVKEA